ncbi:MAG: DUF4347 domain-containing protein, partial [bacterium]|nr:DUF4347 domain-containing protein [bacterium]
GAAVETVADAAVELPSPVQDAAAIEAAKLVEAAADVVPPAVQADPAPQRTEILFIESNVADYQVLIDGAKPGTEVHVLDASRDGLVQMAQILDGRSGIDAIHIMSHGSEASVGLGSLTLTAQNLSDHAADLETIGHALNSNADILLYGCDVAKGSDGAAFVEALAQSTQADIAASNDLTGSSSLGGDWTLEVVQGNIDAQPVVTAATADLYQHVLSIANATMTFGTAGRFTSTGGYTPATQDVVYKINNDANYALTIDGLNTGVYADTGVGYINIDFTDAGTETKLTLSISAGKVFTPGSIDIINQTGTPAFTTQDFVFKAYDINGTLITSQTNTIAAGFSTTPVTFSGMTDTHSLVITSTSNGGKIRYSGLDNFVVSNVQSAGPTITSATYDASTNSLVVTGVGMTATGGAANDIDVTKLTLTGQGGATYLLTSASVEIDSATQFTVALNAADQINVEGLLNKNGISSVGVTTYNIAAAADWNTANLGNADATGNGITVSNVQTPTITSSTYDASNGTLAVTGTNLVKASGATNDITANKLTFTGEGGATYTLMDTSNVEITSGTAFTIILSATDQAAINQMINKNGTSSTGATTYNLAAADDWNTVITNGDISDATGNGITVSNVPVPAITSSTYDASSGALVVTGTGFLKLSGATNDIVANKFTFTGEGGATYTLTDTANVEITSGTAFTLTLSATDKDAINQMINKNGTSSSSGTTYNLAAAEDWTAGAAAGVTDTDLTGNGITAGNVAVPAITSSTYDAATGALVVSGTGFLQLNGATNDIVANKFTFKGEGNATYTLTDTSNVEITSGTAFTITLSATDKAAVNQFINKNGASSSSGTTYNLAAAEDWTAGAAAGVTDVDGTNGITAGNVAVPAITSSTYDAATGALVVTGSGFLSKSGATNDIVANKFTFTGEGGATYTLTDTSNVEITSGTAFTIT